MTKRSLVVLSAAIVLLTRTQLVADPCDQPWTFANSVVTTTCGNVGIGTTTPLKKLQVAGNAVLGNSASPTDLNGAYFVFDQGSPGWGQYSYGMTLGFAGGRWRTMLFSPSGADFAYSAHLDGAAPAGQGSFTERLTVRGDSGYVGIGQKAPRGLLEVAGGQTAPRIVLSGTEYYQGFSHGGLAMLLGVNRLQDHQLWLGDIDALTPNSSNVVLRLAVRATSASLDAVSTDATVQKTLNLGSSVVVQPDGLVNIANFATPQTGDKLVVNGAIRATSVIGAVYQDLAEWVPATEAMPPGTVVVVDDRTSNTVTPSSQPYDTRVAGVVSAQPGLLLGIEAPSKEMIATTGRVKVRVDASSAPIHLGDLLVTSDKPGVAMRSEVINLGGLKIHRPGTLIGKALEPLASGKGEILVLLSLQ